MIEPKARPVVRAASTCTEPVLRVACWLGVRSTHQSIQGFRCWRCLETQGLRIPYLSPQDLIFLKQDSWRDKDKLDVLAMQEMVRRESEAAGKTPGS